MSRPQSISPGMIRLLGICLCLAGMQSMPTILHAAAPTATAVTSYQDPVTGFTSDQALKLGMDAFVDQYIARTNDDSTAGTCNAYNAYAKLCRVRNKALVDALPRTKQILAVEMQTVLGALVTAGNTIEWSMAGGGTMYIVIDAGCEATLVEKMGDMIRGLDKPVVNKTARKQTGAALEAFGSLVKKAVAIKAIDEPYRVDYRKAVKDLQAQQAKLRALCRRLPDNTALLVSRYAQQMLAEKIAQ